jgi:hypothetical protein
MTGKRKGMMRPTKLVKIVAAIGLAMTMSACDGGDGIQALDGERTSEDQLSAYVSTDDLDTDSVRKAVEADGFTYFLAEGRDSGYCLIRTGAQDGSDHITGCSTGSGHLTTTSLGSMSPEPRSMVLVTDGYTTKDLEDDGWTKIHQNIVVQ